MAAIKVTNQQLRPFSVGTVGCNIVTGVGQFNSTDASGELQIRHGKRIENVQLTAIGTPAADEILSVNETENGGVIAPDTSGNITIARTGASKTADLKFFFRYELY